MLLAVSLVFSIEARAFDLSGYFKTFFVANHLPGAVYQRVGLEGPWVGSVSQRLRLDTFHRFNERLAFNLSYAIVARVQDPLLFGNLLFDDPRLAAFANASGYRAYDLDVVLLPRNESDIHSFAILQNLDRLFFTVNFKRFDLFVGRQAIAWGSARVVNPTDVLAPFQYSELDTEDRIGIDAARLRAPLGALGEFDVGYVAGENFETTESAFFARGKTYAAATDLAALVLGFREHLMVGADVTRAIGGAGSWLEAAYVFAYALSGDRKGTDEDYLRLSVGLDYSFPNNIYTYVEYHYNQPGASDPDDYTGGSGPDDSTGIIDTPAYRDGAVFLLGQHYLIPGASFQITPLLSLLGQTLMNLTDPSVLLVGVLDYNVSEDIFLEFGAYLGLGDSPELYTSSFVERPFVTFNSEFGSFADMLYTSFRIYF
ncbi:MAG: hypothetical protein JSW50_03185 [Candidatus Latescibacterota bacterium]|nr:MAG: hypothetical protein JSW50_03185 [Candidatus Latescibacterota bacterium]